MSANGVVRLDAFSHSSHVSIDDPIPELKERLRQAILAEVGKWSQVTAAAILHIDQARMSNLERGRLKRFSVEKLIRILAVIDQRVDITVVNVSKGRLRVFDSPHRR